MEDRPIKLIPDDIPNWSENYALAGFDPVSGIDIFLALGRWRKDLSMWREMIAIALPDGTVLAHRNIGKALATPDRAGGSNLVLDIIREGSAQTWSFAGGMRRVSASNLANGILQDGPLERVGFSIRFESNLPQWYLGKSGSASAVAGHAHVEQMGRTVATIEVGDTTMRFDSIANRDHSRGPRVLGPLTRHVWFHGQFENGIGFYAYEMFEGSEISKPLFSKASVIRDGVEIPATMRFGSRLPDRNPMEHVNDKFDVCLEFEGGSLNFAILDFPTVIHIQMTAPWDNYIGVKWPDNRRIVEQSARYRMLDGTMGYGHMERTVPGPILQDCDY